MLKCNDAAVTSILRQEPLIDIFKPSTSLKLLEQVFYRVMLTISRLAVHSVDTPSGASNVAVPLWQKIILENDADPSLLIIMVTEAELKSKSDVDEEAQRIKPVSLTPSHGPVFPFGLMTRPYGLITMLMQENR